MGRDRQRELDQLIDDVARGRRELGSIRDPRQRELVRIALRLHDEAPAEPDAYTRMRMRVRVLGALGARRTTLGERAWAALELVARPAPYLARGVAILALAACFGMSALVVGADALPEDALYPLKLGAENVRLALASSPDERAVIELSIAAHRLREAEQLAASGRTTDALVASAMYTEHVAWAAAELASDAPSDLARQLELRFDADRSSARTLANTLSGDARSADAAQVLALIAQPGAPSSDVGMQRVASAAAGVAASLVQAAERQTAPQGALQATAASSRLQTVRGALEQAKAAAAKATAAKAHHK